MEILSYRNSFFQLDDLCVRHIVNYLDIKDIINLSMTSQSFYHLLHKKYTFSLSFPLDKNYMIKEEAEKPLLAILTNGTTDQGCQFNTNKQVAKIYIGNLKLLRLRCPNEDSEDCINSCSYYHQRILYNIYHRHWKRGSNFNLQSLRITVYDKVNASRLRKVLPAMTALSEVKLHIHIQTGEHMVLIQDVCAQPSIRRVFVTILLNPLSYDNFGCKITSKSLEELSVTGVVGLQSVSMADCPKLETLRLLPESTEENIEMLGWSRRQFDKERKQLKDKHLNIMDPISRFVVLHQECPSLQSYNDVYIGDICRDDFQKWTRKIVEALKNCS